MEQKNTGQQKVPVSEHKDSFKSDKVTIICGVTLTVAGLIGALLNFLHVTPLPDIWTSIILLVTIIQTVPTIWEPVLKMRDKRWIDVGHWIAAKSPFVLRPKPSEPIPPPPPKKNIYLSIIYHREDVDWAKLFEQWLNKFGCYDVSSIPWDEGDASNVIKRTADYSSHVLLVLSSFLNNNLQKNPTSRQDMKELVKLYLPEENRPVGMTVVVDGYTPEVSLKEDLDAFILLSNDDQDIGKFLTHVYPDWLKFSSDQNNLPNRKTSDQLLADLRSTPYKSGSGQLGDPIWKVSAPENPFYQEHKNEKGDLLTQILRRFVDAKATKIPQVIWGINGVGKTELATAYIYKFGGKGVNPNPLYHHVLQIDASPPFDMVCNTLYSLLNLPVDDTLDVSEKKKAIKNWFDTVSGRWLLVLDNYRSDDNLKALHSILPPYPKGDVLLTIQQHSANIDERDAFLIHLEPMSKEEGAVLLLKHYKGDSKLDRNACQKLEGDWEIAQKIVHEMGGLPLGIRMATKKMHGMQWSPKRYLEQYIENSIGLFRENDEYNELFNTFFTSFQKAHDDPDGAGEILQLFAMLSPDHPIPFDILKSVPTFAEKSALKGSQAFRALALLSRLSFITKSADDTQIYLNKLVHAIVRKGGYPDPCKNVSLKEMVLRVEHTVEILNQVFSRPDILDKDNVSRYLPHVHTCYELIKKYGIATKAAVQLLDKVSRHLNKFPHDEKEYKLSTDDLLETSLSMRKDLPITLSNEQLDLETPTSLCILAERQQERLFYKEAETLYLEALKELQKKADQVPSSTLAASTLPATQTGVSVRVLASNGAAVDRRQNTISTQTDEATIYQHMGGLYSEWDKFPEAERRIKQAWEDREEQLRSAREAYPDGPGPKLSNHVQDALLKKAICNRAAGIVFMRKGQASSDNARNTAYKEAEKYLLAALEALKELRARGSYKNHYYYWACCEINLATLYTLKGGRSQKKARQRFQSALDDLTNAQKALDLTHDGTIRNDLQLSLAIKYNNLAELYRVRDKKQAEQHYKDAMKIYEQHQDKTQKWQLMMLGTLYNYVVFLREMGADKEKIKEHMDKFREIKQQGIES